MTCLPLPKMYVYMCGFCVSCVVAQLMLSTGLVRKVCNYVKFHTCCHNYCLFFECCLFRQFVTACFTICHFISGFIGHSEETTWLQSILLLSGSSVLTPCMSTFQFHTKMIYVYHEMSGDDELTAYKPLHRFLVPRQPTLDTNLERFIEQKVT